MYGATLTAITFSYDLDLLVRYFCVRDYTVAYSGLVSSPVLDRSEHVLIGEFALRFSKRCSEVDRISHIPIIWHAHRILDQMAD